MFISPIEDGSRTTPHFSERAQSEASLGLWQVRANVTVRRHTTGTLLALGFMLAFLIGAARADDKDNPAPTNWWVFSNQTAAGIGDTLQTLQNQTGQQVRISDVQVTAPNNFTVTYVQNTHSYGKQWWWYPNIDDKTLSAHLTTNNARLISLRAYDVGSGNVRYIAAMISNSGADQKEWWWGANLTYDAVKAFLQQRRARLTSLQSYRIKGQTLYAVTMILNSGADGRAWWWYINAAPQFIGSTLTANKARLVDLTPAGNGNFNVVMEGCSGQCAQQWWYFGHTGSDTMYYAGLNGRISTAEAYPGCGNLCYASIVTQGSAGNQHGILLDWYPGSKPFDLVWATNSDGTVAASGYDANGYPLNPIWFAQMGDPANGAESPSFAADCSGTTGSGTLISEFCSSQNPLLDLYTGSLGSFGVCHQNDTVIDGHLSFYIATYTGNLYFDDWSDGSCSTSNIDACGADHDYNLALVRKDYSGMTSARADDDSPYGVPASAPGRLHVEFNSDETIDSWFVSPWWQKVRQSVEEPRGGFLSSDFFGGNAVVTGVVSIDGVHKGGYTELHPAFSMAVEDPPTKLAKGSDLYVTQQWHFFIRNHGTQGTCSHMVYGWPTVSGSNSPQPAPNLQDYYIQLPWAAVGNQRAASASASGEAWTPLSPAPPWSIEFETGSWTLLHFKIPYLPVSAQTFTTGFVGDVTLEYKFPGAAKLASQIQPLMLRAGAAGPTQHPVESEIVWTRVLARIPDPSTRGKLQSFLVSHPMVVSHPHIDAVAIEPRVLTIAPAVHGHPRGVSFRPEGVVDPDRDKYLRQLKAATGER